MEPILDPRGGDFEDDASSTKRRTLLSLASSLLVEISLPKLALAWLLMLVLPSLVLGLAPLTVSAWLKTVKWKFTLPRHPLHGLRHEHAVLAWRTLPTEHEVGAAVGLGWSAIPDVPDWRGRQH